MLAEQIFPLAVFLPQESELQYRSLSPLGKSQVTTISTLICFCVFVFMYSDVTLSPNSLELKGPELVASTCLAGLLDASWFQVLSVLTILDVSFRLVKHFVRKQLDC